VFSPILLGVYDPVGSISQRDGRHRACYLVVIVIVVTIMAFNTLAGYSYSL
jgi:hypothetical protein